MLALVLLALAPTTAGALQLQDPLGCPSEQQLRTALGQHAPELEGALKLERASDGEVQVSWTTGARHFTRALRLSPSDCTAAAETVALLVQAWKRALPTSARPDALSEAAHVEVHTPRNTSRVEAIDAGPPSEPTPEIPAVDAGEESLPVADAGLEAAAAPPAESVEPPAPAAEPPPPDAGPVIAMAELPNAAEVHAEPTTAPAVEPSSWHVRAGLEGRGALGLGSSERYAAGALALELGRGDFGAQLDLAIDTAQHGARTPGQVTALRQTLAARALIRIHPLGSRPSFAVRLTFGPMVERLDASSAHYARTEASTVYAPGLAAGAAAELPLGPVRVGFGPEFELLAEQTDFTITGVGPVLSLPRAWAGLALGVRGELF